MRALQAVCAALAFGIGYAIAAPVGAAEVTTSLIDLGYRDGVTVSGVAPSVTFDLPRYTSLQAATLHLELHVSAATDPASTITIAVNGKPVETRVLREVGNDAKLVVPLPVPSVGAPVFSITVSGAFSVTGDACANNSSSKLFLRIGRASSLVLRTASGGTAEAFFRDYRADIAVHAPLDDPRIAGVPYELDRLEPWHRVTARLVSTVPKTGRRIVFVAHGPTVRSGDELRITPAAFYALPVPQGQSPFKHAGTIAFGDLGQHLGSATGTGDLSFELPLKGSVTGGVPQHLAVHAEVQHSALPAGATATLQVFVNGILAGARDLGRSAETEALDVAVPQAIVGPSNSVRIVVATDVPAGACAGAASAITAALLDSSTFSWSGIVRKPPSIESFITALNGRVIVLVAPEFTRAAFHLLGSVGRLNAAIATLDVAPFTGSVPGGYDYAIVFAPPGAADALHLPVRTGAPAFVLVNPTDNRSVFTAAAAPFALLALGDADGTPLLAVSYHGDARALGALDGTHAAELATQVADVSVVDASGVTVYDVGEKLRPRYPDALTLGQWWSRIRLPVAVVLLMLIIAGGRHAAHRLTGRTI